MKHLIDSFYQKYIHTVDPGLFITRFAFKSVLTTVTALLAGYLVGMGPLLQWCAFGALGMIILRAGSTFKTRKIMARRFVLLSAALVPISTLFSGLPFIQEAYIFIVAFCAIFARALGPDIGTICIGVLLVNLLTLGAPPAGLAEGMERAASLVFGGAIAYLCNFHLWPTHPERIRARTGALALTELGHYLNGVVTHMNTPGAETTISTLQKRAVNAIKRYRRFMEAMNINPLDDLKTEEGPTAFYSVTIRMMESIVGLANSCRLKTQNTVFAQVKPSFEKVAQDAVENFNILARNAVAPTECRTLKPLTPAVKDLEKQLLEMGAYRKGDHVQKDFLEAWGAVHAIGNLVQELEEAACMHREAIQS